MTKMMSAHSTCSDDNSTLAPLEMPAESVSIPGQVEKICSAVGLRRRLALQTNKDVGHDLIEGDAGARPSRLRPKLTLPEQVEEKRYPGNALDLVCILSCIQPF